MRTSTSADTNSASGVLSETHPCFLDCTGIGNNVWDQEGQAGTTGAPRALFASREVGVSEETHREIRCRVADPTCHADVV